MAKKPARRKQHPRPAKKLGTMGPGDANGFSGGDDDGSGGMAAGGLSDDSPGDDDDLTDPAPPQGPAGAAGTIGGFRSEGDMGVKLEADGSATIDFSGDSHAAQQPNEGFFANLAATAPADDLQAILVDLDTRVRNDIDSRAKREEQYAEGVKRTGIVYPAPGGAEFEGASKVTHPLLAQVCVDYAARVIKELFPRTGPVKAKIPGTWTHSKQARSDRKVRYFNNLLLDRAPEIKAAVEVLATQEPLSGEGYLKVLWDARRLRPTVEYLSAESIVLPPGIASFETTHRFTHRFKLARAETLERIRSGLYQDVDLPEPETTIDVTPADEARDDIAGGDPHFAQGEGFDEIREVHLDIHLTFDEEGQEDVSPYIISYLVKDLVPLSVRRNWSPDAPKDAARLRDQTVVQFGLIPWDSGVFLGVWDLAGSLTIAATGALRALMDSALANAALTGVRLKGTRVGGQNVNPSVGEVAEIEGTAGVDDVRKLIMTIPFNPPPPVLFELLKFLLQEGRGLIQTALEDSAMDTNANTPVGTQLSRVEQVMTVFSAVFARQHDSFNRVLRIMHTLCARYLSDQQTLDDEGELTVSRMDFQGAPDVIPASDPAIYSDMQRYAQLQAVRQMATTAPPGQYDLRAVDHRMLELMHVDGIDELMPPPKPPERRHAVSENAMIAMGAQVMAYPDQDHLAHLSLHIGFATNPILGGNPANPPSFLSSMLNHCRQHMLMLYAKMMRTTVMQKASLDDLDGLTASIEDQNALDVALATVAHGVEAHFTQAVQPYVQAFVALQQQAAQQAQQAMQKQLQAAAADPRVAAQAQAAQASTQQKAQEAQQDAALRAKELEAEATMEQARLAAQGQQNQQDNAARVQVEQIRTQSQTGIASERHQADIQREAVEDRTALEIAAQRQEEGDKDREQRAAEFHAELAMKGIEVSTPDPEPQGELPV